MRRVLLDTSAYSALVRGHAGVQQALGEADEVALSVVVLGELRAGFLGGGRAASNEKVLRRFLEEPRVQVLDVDEETASRYAVIRDDLRRRGTPVPVNDVWIAATASQHGLRVLTTDRDFQQIPQVVAEVFESTPRD